MYNIRRKNVWIPNDAYWINDFRSEILAFPKAGHDDQVDALSQLIISCFLKPPFNVKEFAKNMSKLKFQMWAYGKYGIFPEPPADEDWHF